MQNSVEREDDDPALFGSQVLLEASRSVKPLSSTYLKAGNVSMQTDSVHPKFGGVQMEGSKQIAPMQLGFLLPLRLPGSVHAKERCIPPMLVSPVSCEHSHQYSC
jgi:hypothetical protein